MTLFLHEILSRKQLPITEFFQLIFSIEESFIRLSLLLFIYRASSVMPFLIHSYYFRTIIITVCRYSFSFFLSTFFIIRKRRWRRFPRLFHPLLTSLKTIQFKFNKLEGKRCFCFREKTGKGFPGATCDFPQSSITWAAANAL